MTAPGPPLGAGALLAGRYRVASAIATGGMATVWRATDTVLARPVAVKVLHRHLAADPSFVRRFRREAVAAARLNHPNIVAIYDTCDDPEAIVMELVEGRTLRDELDRRGFLPPAEAVAVASAMCQALEVAHRAGVVHRDVKPGNVLLATDGQLKVADFGIAKAAAELPTGDTGSTPTDDVTTVGQLVGTAKYLAPEQVTGGQVDPRTDVYAVGAVVYEMLCGRPPFTGPNDLAVATARLQGQPDRLRAVLPTVPAALDAVVMRALSREPGARQASAGALWADLQSCVLDDDAPTSPARVDEAADPAPPPSFGRAERGWLVPTALVGLVAVALVVAWMLIGGTQARDLLLRIGERDPAGGGEPASAGFSARAFDPLGDGTEHDELVPLVEDGDPDTAWQTERYDSADFGQLKSGVGLVLALDEPGSVDEVVVTSAQSGWAAEIYVADRDLETFEGWWGPVTAVVDAPSGPVSFRVEGATASHVLVWFVDLGHDDRVVLEVSGVRIHTG